MASIISAGTTSGTSLNLSGDTSGVLQLQTNGTTSAVTITTAQNVGIGTTSPATKLQISESGAGPTVNLNRLGDTSGNAVIRSTGSTGTINASITLGGGSDNLMTFATGTSNTERMRIDSSGNVGVRSSGTTTPTYDFNTLGEGLWFRYWDSSGNRLADLVAIGNTPAGATQAMRFFTNSGGSPGTAVERMRLNAGTNILCLAGGSTTATGTGIAFPATQSASSDANTLDDYEEGTWTPSYSGTGSNPTVTYGAQVGRYTKIGNRVYIQLTIDHSAKSGGSGTLTINLPFQVSSVTNNYPSFVVGYSGAVTPASKTGYTDPARSDFFLQAYNLSTGNYDVSALNASGTLMVSAQYQVD